MSYNRTFKTPQQNNFASDYISKKKAKTVYADCVNKAKNGRRKNINTSELLYHKNTRPDFSGKSMGIYRGDVWVSKNECLIGAHSYDALLTVTKGKWLETPPASPLVNSTGDLWYGQFAVGDYRYAPPLVTAWQGSSTLSSNASADPTENFSQCDIAKGKEYQGK